MYEVEQRDERNAWKRMYEMMITINTVAITIKGIKYFTDSEPTVFQSHKEKQ